MTSSTTSSPPCRRGVWETVPDTETPVAERGSTACLCHCSGWKSIPAQHDRALQDCQGSESPQLPQLGVQADLQWWRAFTLTRNGRCVLLPALQATPDEEGFTDAFGSWGCGGTYVAKRMVLISMVPYLGRHKHHNKRVEPDNVDCNPVGTTLGRQDSAVPL